MFEFLLGFLAGGAAIWFFREPITKWYKGAEDYAGMLKDKLDALNKK